MAIVRRLEPITLERWKPHTEVNGTYSIILEDDGKSLQIDTYGSADRMMPDKKSQSIRFSPEAIEQLKTILANEL
jgi:hypothetical protein